ncbi:hypothetical protein EV359DRAFT_85421 [Lentinula novae-zelandiae]|nr:hypothetical protein EV359DRAFT_85421 [Lentinula novae-zelandiae]
MDKDSTSAPMCNGRMDFFCASSDSGCASLDWPGASLGSASFLLLIAAFLSPPVDPFLAVSERMFLANLARTNLDTSVPIQTALFSHGQYVQAAPSAILAIFIFIRTAILYIRFLTRTTSSVEPSLSLRYFTPSYSSWRTHHPLPGNPVKQFHQAVFAPLQKANSIHLTLLRTTPGGHFVEEFKGHIDSLAGVKQR